MKAQERGAATGTRRDFDVAWVVTTWNGTRLQETLDSLPSGEERKVISTRAADWPLSRAWNYAAREYLRRDHDVVIIANDDIVVRPDTGQQMAWALLEGQRDRSTPALGAHPADGPELLLVTCYNTRDHEDVGPRWGVGAPDYSCFAIGRRYLEVVGEFDETFDPAYFEDNDSHRRIRLAGCEAAQWCPYYHYGSTTLQTDPERRTMMSNWAFDLNRRRYIQKWGGTPGRETFTVPYNGRRTA